MAKALIKGMMRRFVKFAITGCIGFILDFLLTWFFREIAELNQYLANSIGFSVAVINNFYLNKYWTFAKQGGDARVQFGYFLIFSIIGLSLNTLFLFVFTNRFQMNFYIGKCLAIALVFIWNYTINSLVTFNKQSASEKNDYQNT